MKNLTVSTETISEKESFLIISAPLPAFYALRIPPVGARK